MALLRTLLLRHRALALLALAAALCLKAVVPAGYMIDAGARSLTVQLCTDASGPSAPQQITIPLKRGSGEHPGDPAGQKAAPECPYTALNLAMIGGAAPVLLAFALAFLLALGFAPVRQPSPGRASYLRPPLRAPPALV